MHACRMTHHVSRVRNQRETTFGVTSELFACLRLTIIGPSSSFAKSLHGGEGG
jgi:hypothetical protein